MRILNVISYGLGGINEKRFPPDTLARCPFCGNGEPTLVVNNNTAYVKCYECLAETRQAYTPEEAIDIWNTRSDI